MGDPFNFANILRTRPPVQPNFAESYKFAQNLRELADRRRIQEQQLRMRELQLQDEARKAQWEQEDRQRMVNLSQLVAENPDAPYPELVRVGGPVLASRVETDRRNAQTARLTQEQKAADIAREGRQQLVGKQYDLLQQYPAAGYQQGQTSYETPEMRRAALSDEAQMLDLLKPPGQRQFAGREGEPTTAMPTAAQFPGAVGAAFGPKEGQAFAAAIAARQEAAAKATAEAAERAAELPGKKAKSLAEQWTAAAQTVYGIADQPSWTAWLAEQPEAIQKALPKEYNRGAVEFVINKGIPASQRATAAQQAIPNTEFEAAYAATDPNLPATERANRALKRLDQSRRESKVPSVNVNLSGYGSPTATTGGEDFLGTLAPGVAAQVKGIAEGRIAMPPAGSRAPGAQQLRMAVMQYDPGFSEQRAQVRKAFTTGTDARNIGALNTAIVHLGRLAHASEALRNGTFTPANEMYQYLNDKFGSATVTNFGLLKDAVAGEMAAALKGNATDIEIANMKTSIRAANSPAQMLGVVKEGMGILSDKAKTYDERYHREMPDDPWSPILPAATGTLGRFGVPYTGAQRKSGGGAVPDVKNMSTDELKKRLGIGR